MLLALRFLEIGIKLYFCFQGCRTTILLKVAMDRKYPIGIQDFGEIRKGGYVYVDKTELLFRLVNTGKYYFFGRPRRFGKSLMISTLESYFEGRKELFEGLAMEKLEKQWSVSPVLHLDLNNQEYNSRKSLEDILNDYLTRWEKLYGSEASETLMPRYMNMGGWNASFHIMSFVKEMRSGKIDAFMSRIQSFLNWVSG